MKKIAMLLLLLASPAYADTVAFTTGDDADSGCWDNTQGDNLPGLRWACNLYGNVYLSLPLPTLTATTTYDITVWGRRNATEQTVDCRSQSWSRNAIYDWTSFFGLSFNSANAQAIHLDVDVPANGSVEIWCKVGKNGHLVSVDFAPL